MTDNFWINTSGTHSESAFSELVARNVDLVYSAARRLVAGDTHLAEDVTQTVFVDLVRKAGSLPGDGVLAGWLHQHACFTASKTVRTERRCQAREQTAMEMRALDQSNEPSWELIAPHLDEGLNQLDARDRDALVLRFLKQQDLRAVGAALGVSDDAAQKRVARALDKLRELLTRRGITTSAAALSIVLSANAVQAAPVGLAITISTATAMAGTTIAAAATATTKAIAMTTIQKTIIGATLAAAVGTGVYEASQNSKLRDQVQTLQQQQAPLTEQIQQLTGENSHLSNKLAMSDKNAVNKSFKWESVESSDYKQYIANLRAVGCPEQTIRDIIVTDVERMYAQRMAKASPSAPMNYWEAPIRPVAWNQKNAEYTSIQAEKDRVIRELLGIDPQEEFNRRAGLSVPYEEGFEFLSAEKRAQLREIDREHGLQKIANDATKDRDRGREINEWRAAAIKKLLTPEEFNEYEMRSSSGGLATMARAFQPSEQEFRTIFQIEKQFGQDDYSWVDGTTGYAQRKPAHAETEKQFQSALKQALGAQRYAEYQTSLDPNYLILYDMVQDDGLPKDTPLKAYELNRAAEQRAAAIRSDASLSAEARQAALRQLEEQTDKDIAKLVGNGVLKRIRWAQRDAARYPGNPVQ